MSTHTTSSEGSSPKPETMRYACFPVATNLHRNFYMDLVPIPDIRYEIDKVKDLLAKLRVVEAA